MAVKNGAERHFLPLHRDSYAEHTKTALYAILGQIEPKKPGDISPSSSCGCYLIFKRSFLLTSDAFFSALLAAPLSFRGQRGIQRSAR